MVLLGHDEWIELPIGNISIKQWLPAWQHQAITWISVDLQPMRFFGSSQE